MSPLQVLALARDLLGRPDPFLAGIWARSSALLARQALEQAVRQLLIHRARLQGRPSGHCQMVALRVAIDPHLAHQAAWAWSALSNASHHHGYALPPTAAELGRWMDIVEEVCRAADSRATKPNSEIS